MVVQTQTQTSETQSNSSFCHDTKGNSHPVSTMPNLLDELRRQVEFYFSPYNLSNDAYLQHVASMYGGSIPMSVILGFPKVRETLTSGPLMHPRAEMQLVTRALETSKCAVISHDGHWVFPTPSMPVSEERGVEWSSGSMGAPPVSRQMLVSPETSLQSTSSSNNTATKERTTVLVRDLPLHCDVDEVINAFSTDLLKPKSARPDIGNTWYVHFESESDAVKALEASQKKTIAGYPIKARLKSELTKGTVVRDSKADQRPFDPQPQILPMHQGLYQQEPYGAVVLPQDYLNIHQPYAGIQSQQQGMVVPTNLPYGVAAIYPINGGIGHYPYLPVAPMDYPPHAVPVAVAGYPMVVDDSNSHWHQTESMSHGYLPSYAQTSVPHNRNHQQNKEKNQNGDRRKYKKNPGGTLPGNKGSSVGERRQSQQRACGGTASKSSQPQNEKGDLSSLADNGKKPRKQSKKKQQNKTMKKGKKKVQGSQTLSEEEFPSLPGTGHREISSKPAFAYAEALLKPTNSTSTSKLGPPAELKAGDGLELKGQMDKLSLDKDQDDDCICW